MRPAKGAVAAPFLALWLAACGGSSEPENADEIRAEVEASVETLDAQGLLVVCRAIESDTPELNLRALVFGSGPDPFLDDDPEVVAEAEFRLEVLLEEVEPRCG